ncbi:MAG TPA: hypothetical protein VFR81_12815 [Longimicrobium sp.]|nr:hypothetical protein [Longimicrobium sp.]
MLMLALFVSTFFVATPPADDLAAGPPSPPGLNLVDARLHVDGEVVFGPFSVQQSRFGYLYLYLPGRGLYTIGAGPFEGARPSGGFRGRSLAFSAGGAELRIDSRTPILGSGDSDAWVRHDPDFTLNVQGVLYGYGDHPSVAEQWLERFGA